VIALAVNYLYQGALAIPDVVFSAAVVSVLLTDLVSGRLASSVHEPSEAAAPAHGAPVHRRRGADDAPDVALAGRQAEDA
jgi:hypothetical protein